MAYTNWRVSPTSSAPNPFTIPGTTRKYIGTVGSFIDLPDFDAIQLMHAGWVRLDDGAGQSAGTGTTANRPTVNLTKGMKYLDTTVGAMVIYDGKGSWLHHVTGAAS